MRFRNAALISLVAIAAFVLPAAAQSDSAASPSPAAVDESSPVHSASRPAVRVAITSAVQLPTVSVESTRSESPVPTREQLPLSTVGFGAIVGATAKKRATRKAAGKKRDVPMYLDSDVHVMRPDEENPKRKVTTIVRGNRLLDDLEADELTDDEIDELTARRVIRPAKPEEIERSEQQDRAAQREELSAEQTAEITQLRANRESERAQLVAGGVKPEDLVSFDDETASTIAELQTEHAAALAKLDQA